MWRLVYSVPMWALFGVIVFLPLCLLSWIMVPVAAICGAYKAVKDEDGAGNPRVEYHFTWPFMFVFDNFEDGIANDTYVFYPDMFRKIVYWSCIRNPINNLRIVPVLSCKINPNRVYFIGSFFNLLPGDPMLATMAHSIEGEELIRKYDTKIPHWFFAWHGLYSNFYWQFNAFGKLWRFWIGHKIQPADIYGVSTYRQPGAGFATQFKRVKV